MFFFTGFANYAESLGADAVFPEFHSKDRKLITDVHPVMDYDAQETSEAMNRETTNPTKTANFGDITYK